MLSAVTMIQAECFRAVPSETFSRLQPLVMSMNESQFLIWAVRWQQGNAIEH